MFETAGRGLQHHGLRRANERAVMTVVAFNPGLSNAEISRLTGLAPQTVSAILIEIERSGLIRRGEVLRGRRGQPATPIFLNPEGGYAIGCEIGWRHLDVLLINMHAQVLGHIHRDYAYPDASVLPDEIAEAVQALRAGIPTDRQDRLTDLGIAMPTSIWEHVHLVNAPPEQTTLWRELDIAAEVNARCGLDVQVFNDGNAACWAELIASPAPRPSDFIYFLVSCYVAAGIVGQGTLWEGPTGNSANLGSMLVTDAEGKQHPAHFVASLDALEQRLTAAGRPVSSPITPETDWGALEPVLSDWIEDGGRALANVVFNTTAVIECRLAVIDGAMPRAVLERLVACVQRHLATLPISACSAPAVVAGHLGATAPALGAAELPLYRRHFSRHPSDIAG
ncbi:ROK family transcriptional regulator [Devosia sp.]|uniref:ROK family transcriptional regulator n=1 Tax=Devosia sp. TaxID=1871048 RepID=UPI00326542B5